MASSQKSDNSKFLERWHCFCSVKSCPTLCDPMDWSMYSSLSFTICQNWLRLMLIESVLLSNHLILCHLLLLLPSIFPSIRVFSNDLALCISQSVSQFSGSVVSDSLQPHESQHARPPCPSPAPRVHSHSCPSSQ